MLPELPDAYMAHTRALASAAWPGVSRDDRRTLDEGGIAMVLKRVGIWSAARVSGGIYALLGLVIGCGVAVVSLIGLLTHAGAASGSPASPFPALLGVGAIVLVPLFYGVIGLVGGALMASLYNLLARVVGGLEMDLQ
jgi:hypothetical protein